MARIIRTDDARLRSIAEHRASPILEVVMLDVADALPLAVERAEPPWRQAVERSVQDHCDVSDKSEIGRDAFSPYNHRGTAVVASACAVSYVIASINHLRASWSIL